MELSIFFIICQAYNIELNCGIVHFTGQYGARVASRPHYCVRKPSFNKSKGGGFSNFTFQLL
jgi:hypothetical protein